MPTLDLLDVLEEDNAQTATYRVNDSGALSDLSSTELQQIATSPEHQLFEVRSDDNEIKTHYVVADKEEFYRVETDIDTVEFTKVSPDEVAVAALTEHAVRDGDAALANDADIHGKGGLSDGEVLAVTERGIVTEEQLDRVQEREVREEILDTQRSGGDLEALVRENVLDLPPTQTVDAAYPEQSQLQETSQGREL